MEMCSFSFRPLTSIQIHYSNTKISFYNTQSRHKTQWSVTLSKVRVFSVIFTRIKLVNLLFMLTFCKWRKSNVY